MVEWQMPQCIPQRVVLIDLGRCGVHYGVVRYCASTSEIATAVEDCSVEVGTGLRDGIPPLEHVNECVVNYVVSCFGGANQQCGSVDLTESPWDR